MLSKLGYREFLKVEQIINKIHNSDYVFTAFNEKMKGYGFILYSTDKQRIWAVASDAHIFLVLDDRVKDSCTLHIRMNIEINLQSIFFEKFGEYNKVHFYPNIEPTLCSNSLFQTKESVIRSMNNLINFK